jgi:hypothetical protein
VSGASGVLSFVAGSFSGFPGFTDALGLTSVSFLSLGTMGHSFYSFDNVTTAAVAVPISEPSVLILLVVALLSIVLRRDSGADVRVL